MSGGEPGAGGGNVLGAGAGEKEREILFRDGFGGLRLRKKQAMALVVDGGDPIALADVFAFGDIERNKPPGLFQSKPHRAGVDRAVKMQRRVVSGKRFPNVAGGSSCGDGARERDDKRTCFHGNGTFPDSFCISTGGCRTSDVHRSETPPRIGHDGFRRKAEWTR